MDPWHASETNGGIKAPTIKLKTHSLFVGVSAANVLKQYSSADSEQSSFMHRRWRCIRDMGGGSQQTIKSSKPFRWTCMLGFSFIRSTNAQIRSYHSVFYIWDSVFFIFFYSYILVALFHSFHISFIEFRQKTFFAVNPLVSLWLYSKTKVDVFFSNACDFSSTSSSRTGLCVYSTSNAWNVVLCRVSSIVMSTITGNNFRIFFD